ncbi:ATP-dependent 6-phosphofructokinase 2 [Linum grandiflorum]
MANISSPEQTSNPAANAPPPSPFKLQRLPHLTDYLPDQIKTRPNPLQSNPYYHPSHGFYISQSDVVLRHITSDLSNNNPTANPAYHRVGPRDQEVVIGLWELYGVRQIYAVSAGYRGFYDRDPVKLDPKLVHNLHKKGGTVLETSRGGFDLEKIVDGIQRHGFNQVPLSTYFDCFH